MEDFNLFIKQCYRIIWSEKNIESKNPKFAETKNGKKCFYQNAKCVIVKNQNLWKSKKPADYWVV